MKINRLASASRWLLALVLLIGSGSALSVNDYTLLLKVDDAPCLSYTFQASTDGTLPATETVVLTKADTFGTNCDGVPQGSFPSSVTATASLQPFPRENPDKDDPNDPAGPSRVGALDTTNQSLELDSLGVSDSLGTWEFSTGDGTYFIYNSVFNTVPSPAVLPLVLGGAGMLALVRRRRRNR